MKYLLVLLLALSSLYAGTNDYIGQYVCDQERYVKTVVLNSDGYGAWTYHSNKSSSYDYDEKVSWEYDETNHQIIIELLTEDADGRIQKKGSKFFLQFKTNGLQPKGSEEVFIKK
ncbi:MAG: hypothetical protein PF439_06740 [Helicobacteraceae bacterium]|jgi:hypothetical protein|nr:hypothetical protein [Helicobacteraceae bacterium]